MINFSGLNTAADKEEDDDSEPPAKKPAITSEEDNFNLLFGQKEDLEAEGQVQSDDHLQHIEDELEQYVKEAEINFRKDDPLLWRNHESYFPTIAKLARKYLCIPASQHLLKGYFQLLRISFRRKGVASYLSAGQMYLSKDSAGINGRPTAIFRSFC